jgi:hypothetical protein
MSIANINKATMMITVMKEKTKKLMTDEYEQNLKIIIIIIIIIIIHFRCKWVFTRWQW